MRMRSVVTILIIVAACLVWIPFKVDQPVAQSEFVNNKPVREIIQGTTLVQTGQLPKDSFAAGHVCFGILFATYGRENHAKLKVGWQQGSTAQSWQVEAQTLNDNQFRYFCPESGISSQTPFAISIDGLTGGAGDSPNTWSTEDTSLGQYRLNGVQQDLSLIISVRRRLEVTPTVMLKAAHGGFFVSWFASLLLAVVLAWWSMAPSQQSGHKDMRRR